MTLTLTKTKTSAALALAAALICARADAEIPGLAAIEMTEPTRLMAAPWRASEAIASAEADARFIAETWVIENDFPEEGKEEGQSDRWYKILFPAGAIEGSPRPLYARATAVRVVSMTEGEERRAGATRYAVGYSGVDVSTLKQYGDWRDIFCNAPYLFGANASEVIRRYGPGEVHNMIDPVWSSLQTYENDGIKVYFCGTDNGTLEMLTISRPGFDLLGLKIGESGPDRVRELLGPPGGSNESWREEGEPPIWTWGDERGFVQVYFTDDGERVAKVETGVQP